MNWLYVISVATELSVSQGDSADLCLTYIRILLLFSQKFKKAEKPTEKRENKYSTLEYTYFKNAFFAISHTDRHTDPTSSSVGLLCNEGAKSHSIGSVYPSNFALLSKDNGLILYYLITFPAL